MTANNSPRKVGPAEQIKNKHREVNKLLQVTQVVKDGVRTSETSSVSFSYVTEKVPRKLAR